MIRLIQNAINYMEEHILEDINYTDIARNIGMSGYEFHRAFSLMTNMTVNTYIRNRRLSLAGIELQETDISVGAAAGKYGYETAESFSKAFSRFHGVTPKQAGQTGVSLCLFNPLHIKVEFEGGSMIDYRIEKKTKQTFIAKVEEFPNKSIGSSQERGIADFWKECHRDNSVEPIRNLRPEGKRDLYGLSNAAKKDASMFEYGIGVIIDEETDVTHMDELLADGFKIWETVAELYAVFRCYGKDGSCITEAWNRFFKEFLPNMQYRKLEETDYEIYYEEEEKELFCEVWIPVMKTNGGF